MVQLIFALKCWARQAISHAKLLWMIGGRIIIPMLGVGRKYGVINLALTVLPAMGPP